MTTPDFAQVSDQGGAFKLEVNMGHVLSSLRFEVDNELRKMLELLRMLALHADPADHPDFDEQARTHALFWLNKMLETGAERGS